MFLLKEKNNKDKNQNPQELLFPINSYKKIDKDEEYDRIIETIPAFNHLDLREEHYFHSTDKKAVQVCRLGKDGTNWKVNNEDLYHDLFNPIIETLEQRKEYLDRFSETIQFWAPLVVLPNNLYVVETTKSNNPLEKTCHITFFNQLKEFKKQGRYTIDFVSEDYFLDFIAKKLNPFIKKTRNVAQDKDFLLKDKIMIDE